MKKILGNIKVALLSVVLIGGMGAASPTVVYGAPADDACAGIRAAGGVCDTGSGEAGFSTIIRTIISVLSVVVGAISVIMIIIGGFRYVLSGGDSSATKGAKDTIMYAIIGLVIVLFAQAIVAFVLDRGTTPPPPGSGGDSSSTSEARGV